MSEKEPTAQEMMTTALKRFLGKEVIIIGTFTLAVAGITLYAFNAFAQKVDTQVAADIAPWTRRQEDTERRLDRHLKEEEQRELQQEQVNAQQRADILALYKAVLTRQPQERLEKALQQDGGTP